MVQENLHRFKLFPKTEEVPEGFTLKITMLIALACYVIFSSCSSSIFFRLAVTG